MKFRKTILGSLGFAIVAAGLSVGTAALAAGDATVVTKRQGVMKGQSDHMKGIAGYVKNNEGTPADVAKRAGGLSEIAKIIPSLFPEGTGMDEIKQPRTGAKPEIWLDRAGFEKAAKTLQAEAEKLMTVAAGGDKAAIAVQFGAMGKIGCGGCHKTFREKLE